MSLPPDVLHERRRAALAMQSSVGAAVAGAGVGALLAPIIGPAAWLILGVGLLVHIFGMVGTRRFLARGGYTPSRWEQAGYWLCWAIILALLAYLAMQWLAGGQA